MLSLFSRFFNRPRPVAALPAAGRTDEALRVLFENGAAGIAEVDMSSRHFVRVNRRFCEIMRRPASQLLRMGPADVIHPDDLQASTDAWLAAMAKTGQWDATVRHLGTLGETIWLRLGVSLYKRDENGDPAHCIAVVQDVTESILATEKLRESEQMLRLGQQVGQIGSFCRDLTTQLITCSSQTREIFGLPPGDGAIPTQLWLASIVSEDRERCINTVNAALASHARELACDYRIQRIDGGGVRHVEMRVRYHYDAEGRALRSMGVLIDVTERKQAEDRLRASETLLRLGMKVGGIGAYKRDFLRGGEIECGPETRALHGIPEGDQPIPAATWLARLLPEDAERMDAEIRAAQDRRQQEYFAHYRFRRSPDGPIRHMEARDQLEYDDEGRPLSAIGVVIDVTDRKEAEQQLAHAARHDSLTGLPNRAFFRERMNEALARARRGEKFALLCLDLDRFKEVNDTLGHPVGDLLLIDVTTRLRAELREVDTLARLGGDEFAIIQSGLSGPQDCIRLAQRLIERISAPFEIEGQHLAVGVSVGIAMAPEDGAQHEDLLKAADLALYRAKAEGRGAWRCFKPEMNERMQMRRVVEMELRQALECGEFELHYQPIVEASTRRIKSFEALIRWRHPERGLIAPDAFIPLCEEIGAIAALDAWVLREACAQATHWPKQIGVAVNISPVQFTGRHLVDTVAAALDAAGLAPERLEIEITETAMLHHTEAALAILQDLKKLGVRIAMDDFGTGYSSLNYLQSFPFDKIKIDRTFTQGLNQSRHSDAIIQAVASLCDGLDICATAEGVETEVQFEALLRRGCREAQGFLISHACKSEEIPALIAQFGMSADWPQAAE